MHNRFVHLHVHTQYSLLDGASKIDELVKQAVKKNFPALAITDYGNLFGVIEFYQECMKQGIKPIIGMTAYIAPQSRFERSTHGIKDASFRLVLLARNERGYKNLIKLSSMGYLEGFYYKPRIDKACLKELGEGLIGLSAGLKGEVAYYVARERFEEAEKAIQEYQDCLGKENFYLEIHNHGIPEEEQVRCAYKDLAKKTGARLVATNDVHYVSREDARAREALLCIQSGANLDDPHRLRSSSDDYYLKSAEEMEALFSDFPEALHATMEIAGRACVELSFKELHLPNFTPPNKEKKETYLRRLCEEGLLLRKSEISPKYRERLEYELKVIEKMGYVSYFLIVWDFIRYAKEKGIPVGPGRGSAAGSLVSHALGITDLDPIVHGLIFERFLNPDRISMPDIDIDFCYERREEVIDYVKHKYGEQNVAQIITFGTMAARGVIRDVGRIMGLSYPDVDKIAKMIPVELEMTLDKALKVEPKLKELVKSDAKVNELIEISKLLEGNPRHASTHAAGIVISDLPLTEYLPLFKQGDIVSTQFTMGTVEKIGLLKMDFLGLRTLTVISETIRLIQATRGVTVDFSKMDFGDLATYELLSRGETFGIFQLESSGMRDILRKMKMSRFQDIVALLALYRPGPLGSGMVDDFIRRRHDASLIQYDHPALEPILKETYGVILYQEQVMQIVSVLAGFNLAKADSLRRAIGKKIPEEMEKSKNSFIEGAKQNQVSQKIAEKIWNLIEYFAGYGFNKSHSAAYAVISYQTAYLKSNYPVEFMTALLTSEKDNTDKLVRYIEEVKRLGIQILPPSVNESEAEFTSGDGKIRFGLSAVKNVGFAAIEAIQDSRKRYGKFNSLFHFTEHVDLRVVNRKVIESLIKCGAIDEFGLKRAQMMAALDRALDMGNRAQRDRELGQKSLFEMMGKGAQVAAELSQIPDIPEWPENQLLSYEREILGFFVTSHPLTKFTKIIKMYASATTTTLGQFKDQEEVSIGGLVQASKEILTKKGDKMAFVTLEDLAGTCEIVIFSDLYKKAFELLSKDTAVFIKGRINLREDLPKIVAGEILPLSQASQKLTRMLTIDVSTAGLNKNMLERLKDALLAHKGSTPVYLTFRDPSGKRTVLSSGDSFKVNSSEGLFDQVEALLGENAIHIKT
ncbi:MAG: DNA polymerase III subunit alpha [Candidatus Omnitrophica bacterium]|nr:DNA polymerase III subunit alpha [Candidatus Omnitrophota bacterium]